MMKFIFMLVMLIPLCLKNLYWLVQVIWFGMSFLFLLMLTVEMSFSWVSYGLGLDLLSYLMVVLSFWICALMLMASEKIYMKSNWGSLYLLVMLILMGSLYLTFCSLNFFIFYLFFEVSLIPTLILILGWGYQPERLQAGVYLLFYTMVASLPMMISLFYCYKVNYSLVFYFLGYFFNSFFVFTCMSMVFLVKIPMFMVHLWLPKAHVEAPVAGSMILAGIMLKLGGYGLIRVMMMFMKMNLMLGIFFISLSLLGGLIISLVCIRQSDMKSLIAYSSVAHMGLALSGIFTLNFWGLSGALVMMVAHGLCSSGLFCLANISYERLMSRSLYLNKGLINLLPSLALWWFFLVSSNMAAPPSLNLLGEIMLINSILCFSNWNMLFLSLISFFSAAYSLYLYSFSQHGEIYVGSYSYFVNNIREFLLLILHWLPLNFLILKGDVLV
uniref:NADH-ubiquinone oxidoreductase chain 4 n=1 Tax=Ischnomera caerulea TaxID=295983 RepID=A0A0S2MQ97_9CUCU|nr:NADH deshydrogenase subunit 4 [Ischnomera caerulea]